MMTRADWAVLVVAIALLPMLYIKLWSQQSVFSESVELSIPGSPTQNLSLRENRELHVEGPLGVSTIEIRDGKVRFVDSPCENKQCVHAGWLEKTGDFAACIPNRISLFVAGESLLLDTINF